MEEKKYRWLVKETLFDEWRELPGEYTPKELWLTRQQGRFWAAKPLTNPPPKSVDPKE